MEQLVKHKSYTLKKSFPVLHDKSGVFWEIPAGSEICFEADMSDPRRFDSVRLKFNYRGNIIFIGEGGLYYFLGIERN